MVIESEPRIFEIPGRPLFAALALALLAMAPVGCGGDDTGAQVRRIIDDLAAQRFQPATARYRAEEERVLSPAAAPAWRRGLEHEDPTVREWAVDALSRIGEAEDVAIVASALDDPFRRVQEAAARGLSAMDPVAAAEAFTSRLEDGAATQRIIAAQGLADLGDPSATPALIGQLRDDALEAGVRGVIAQSLAALGDDRAIAPLAAVAGDAAADLQLRRTAADALATFETAAADEALRGLLSSDDTYVRDVARRVLEARRP